MMGNKEKWMLDKIEILIELIYVYDFMQKNATFEQKNIFNIHDKLCNLLFTMLWITMGANIPDDVYKINDYSVLWGILDDNDEIEIED